MNIEILGKSFPMSMGLDAVKEITAKMGCTMEQMGDVMTAGTTEEQIANVTVIAAAMARSAYRREKVRCALWGEECKLVEPPDAEQMLCAFDLLDSKKLIEAVTKTMQEANKTTVDVEPSKNAKSHA